MKRPPFSATRGLTHGLAVLGLLASSLQAAPDLILDEVSVAHLNLEFAEAEETTFEETVFALGVIEAHASSSSSSPSARTSCGG